MSIAKELEQSSGIERDQVEQHFTRSQKSERIGAMMRLAKPYLAVTPDAFDADPWVFNVNNGLLCLRTGTIRPHNHHDMVMKLAPVDFDPKAESPVFHDFMRQIFSGDEELIAFVQFLLGYALTGDIREPIMGIAYGAGANGKSVLLETVMRLMGDYAATTKAGLFVESRGGQNEQGYELAKLQGARLVVASESDRGGKLEASLVKNLTGDEVVDCRQIYGKPFSYRRTYKPLLVTNYRPRVDWDSEAIWRRLRLIPFDVVIPVRKRNAGLKEELWREAPGILRWILDGCLGWQRYGLGEPDAVKAATDAYRDESDPLKGFLEECCELIPDAFTLSKELRRTYTEFCDENGDRPMRDRSFADLLKKHGCKPERRFAGRGWKGIALRSQGYLSG